MLFIKHNPVIHVRIKAINGINWADGFKGMPLEILENVFVSLKSYYVLEKLNYKFIN